MSEHLKVLVTVKTIPIPSAKYDELVCTAGVTETGDFIRLYPINFRDLPYRQSYRKYQWLEVDADRHTGRDTRKESYRPDCGTIRLVGEAIPTKGNWSERSKYVLAKASQSMEELHDKQDRDKTSLGIFRPKEVLDLVVKPVDPDWKSSFTDALRQGRFWENRKASREAPRKVPFKFQYRFRCDDARCTDHQMMIEDWEIGALYWRCIDGGATPEEACEGVKKKFLGQLCAPELDTHFYVGTVLAHPKSWVIIGVYYPKKISARQVVPTSGNLFDL
jgi:hypothetical protein